MHAKKKLMLVFFSSGLVLRQREKSKLEAGETLRITKTADHSFNKAGFFLERW